MENKIKAIALDVDGTLLASSGKTTPKTIEAIQEARKQGYLVGLSTGRDCGGVNHTLPSWNLENEIDFVVGSGGAEIKDYKNNTYKETYGLTNETVKEVIDTFKDIPNVGFSIAIDGKLTTPVDNERVKWCAQGDGVEYQVMALEEMLKQPKPKMVVYVTEEQLNEVKQRIKPNTNYHIMYSGWGLFEVMDNRVSKTNGLKQALEAHNITLEETIAFGDQDNDIDMLTNCGVGVAMGNGSQSAKKAADYIAAANTEDGIALFLNEHLLSK